MQNRLLASMSAETFSHLRPHLQRVVLKPGEVLQERIGRSNTFISSSAASPPCSLARPETVLSKWPLSVAWAGGHTGCARDDAIAQSMSHAGPGRGSSHRITRPEACDRAMSGAAPAIDELCSGPSRPKLAIRVVQCPPRARQRLCRWLLLACERLDDSIIPLTHELLSMTLGVRRAGVTMALARLEEKGALREIPRCD